MRVLTVVGARPNFMKAAPIVRALAALPVPADHVLVHTGQHYDANMSDTFFAELDLPAPDINLGVGGGSQAEQTARVMIAAEPVLQQARPDVVVVVGDVNSTLACTLTAKKLHLPVAHVEAGLRSFDMTMPEEINRRCTDAIADELLTTDRLARENLLREGVPDAHIHFVGNVMIDSLLTHLPAAEERATAQRLGLSPGQYATLTLHRPANVDDPERLAEIIEAIADAVPGLPIVFPVHPRTRQRIAQAGLADRFADDPRRPGIFATDPLGYIDFLSLNRDARLILTDSGGLQEEATVLRVPCVTLRDNTERPITVTHGTNRLAGTRRPGILAAIAEALAFDPSALAPPEKWDGGAAGRIAAILAERYGGRA